jgi:TPR repeat protein
MRVALVIGNDRYADLPADRQLTRAVNDATAVAGKLKGLGFEVVLRTNASRADMLRALAQATHAMEPGGSIVVYFAGHGVEIDGSNYLIPSDAPSPDEASVQLLRDEAISLDTVMYDLRQAGGRLNVVILDACRDNPYSDPQGRSMGGERGLARVDPPSGFFVLYSAGRGQTALDGLKQDSDPNSVYTRVLLRHLADRSPLVDLAKTVQGEVFALARAAGHDQMPAYYDQLEGRPLLTGEAQAASAPEPTAPTPDPRAEELAYWTASNCAGGDLDGCRAYIGKYGQGGRFADLAALKLRPPTRPPPVAAPDANAAARGAVDDVTEADWRGKAGADLLSHALTRVTFAQIEALAATGDARAESLAGEAFDLGIGGQTQSHAQAAVWYRRAAEQGDFRAENNLGNLYVAGQGVTQDYAQAMAWFRKAADQGIAVAQANIAALYENGQGVTQDYAEALAWYRKAADQGNALAQSKIGLFYFYGQGVAQDYPQALAWFRKAADRGDAGSQNMIGTFYYDGRGVTKDYAQALAWFRKAADQGDARGQFNVGMLYDTGHGVAQDSVQARVWYQKSADQGDTDAENQIGDLYYNGRGVARDYAQALIWYRKAAVQGDASAQNNVGAIYNDALGVPRDYAQAMSWYRMAADQGSATAQRNIGELYESGLGVAKDLTQAKDWYRKAAAGGDANAKTWMAAHGG